MRRLHRIVLLAGLIALAPVLAGCEDFDMDKLDIFHLNEKKKLPGERKELFPQGVPGVTQGIPPEYLKGNQPPPDTALTPLPGEAAAVGTPHRAVKPVRPRRRQRPPWSSQDRARAEDRRQTETETQAEGRKPAQPAAQAHGTAAGAEPRQRPAETGAVADAAAAAGHRALAGGAGARHLPAVTISRHARA